VTGVPSAALDVASLLADPHVQARGSVVELDDKELGTLRVPAPAPHLSRTPLRIATTGPARGEHTESVLHDWLGEG